MPKRRLLCAVLTTLTALAGCGDGQQPETLASDATGEVTTDGQTTSDADASLEDAQVEDASLEDAADPDVETGDTSLADADGGSSPDAVEDVAADATATDASPDVWEGAAGSHYPLPKVFHTPVFNVVAILDDGSTVAAGVKCPHYCDLHAARLSTTGVEQWTSETDINGLLGEAFRLTDAAWDGGAASVGLLGKGIENGPWASATLFTVDAGTGLAGQETPALADTSVDAGGQLLALGPNTFAGLVPNDQDTAKTLVVVESGAEVHEDLDVTAMGVGPDGLVTVKNGQLLTYDSTYGLAGFEPFDVPDPERLVGTSAGGWVVLGADATDGVRVARYDAELAPLFDVTLTHAAGALRGYHVFDQPNGGTLVVGQLVCDGSLNLADVWIALLDAGGQLVWERFVTPVQLVKPTAARVLPDGSLVVADVVFSAVSTRDFVWRYDVASSALASGAFANSAPTCGQLPLEQGCWAQKIAYLDDLSVWPGERVHARDNSEIVHIDANTGAVFSPLSVLKGVAVAEGYASVFTNSNQSTVVASVYDLTGDLLFDASVPHDLAGGIAVANDGQGPKVWIVGAHEAGPDADVALFGLDATALSLHNIFTATGDQVPVDVATNPATGGAIIAVRAFNAVDYSDFSIIWTDSDGAEVVTVTETTLTHDEPWAVASTPAGGAVVAGTTASGPSNVPHGLLKHFDASGALVWTVEDTSVGVWKFAAANATHAVVGNTGEGIRSVLLSDGSVVGSDTTIDTVDDIERLDDTHAVLMGISQSFAADLWTVRFDLGPCP